MKIDKLNDDEMFEYDKRIYLKTSKARGYQIVCILLENNETYYFDRDIDVKLVGESK